MKSNLYASESNSTAAGSDEAGVIRFISLSLFGFMVGWLENGILRCSGWWFYFFFLKFSPPSWGRFPFLLIFFQNGLEPPTSFCYSEIASSVMEEMQNFLLKAIQDELS